jgi:hypothetical protein
MATPLVAKSGLICDLIQIIGAARHPRYPRWQFRVDDNALDLAFRPKQGCLQGRLTHPDRDPLDRWLAEFTLGSDNPLQWWLYFDQLRPPPRFEYYAMRARRLSPPSALEDARLRAVDQEVAADIRAQVLAIFNDRRLDVLDPSMMLKTACLVCGRKLTDPLSLHRWIGPECWDRAAVHPATKRFVVAAKGDTEPELVVMDQEDAEPELSWA